MNMTNVQEMVTIENPTSGSIIVLTCGISRLSHCYKKYSYKWYLAHQMVVPQVILNFKWSSSKASSLTNKSSSLSSGWPMLWHRGRCPTNWYQGQRSYMRYLKGYKWCHSNICGGVHKKCKIQVSIAILCINMKHTFYGNWWQRGRSWNKDMKCIMGKSRSWTWTKREKHWRMEKDQISWTREAHK